MVKKKVSKKKIVKRARKKVGGRGASNKPKHNKVKKLIRLAKLRKAQKGKKKAKRK